MRINSMLTTTIAVALLCSCNRDVVNLESTTAKSEVPQLGNLSFRFSQALVPDSLLNQWDSTEYIEFKPAIPGRFRWETPDELVFSPSRPLPAATSFKAKLNSDILHYSKYDRIDKADQVEFRTPDLALNNTNISWILQDAATRTVAPQIDLYFNYPVDPANIKEKLHIKVDEKETGFNLQTLSASNKISLRLSNVKAENKDYDVQFLLDKGLVPESGSNGTREPAEWKGLITSPFVLNINEISAEHDGTTGTIAVRTSQQLADPNQASLITINPAVKFAVELTDEGFMISSGSFDVSKSYELTVSKGLRGNIGGTLRDNYSNNLAFGRLEPSIRFSGDKAVYLSGQGQKNIEVKMATVQKVKVVISKIYESNILSAQRSGYYPRETSRQDGDQGEYYEEEGDVTQGDVVYEKEIDTRSLPKYGNSRLFNFNIEDRLPDFKGIYHIMIRSTEDYWVRDSRFISMSDIGLIAKEGKEKIYVFANSIKTAAPVQEVNLMVYGFNNQLLGMATTNADGVGEISYTRNELAGFRPAMVIAKTAGDFNYLPFSSTKTGTSRFDVGGKRGNLAGLDAFVYAERDVYRPGEKVNFSVIVRNRLWKVPGEMPLHLKFLLPNGKELKTFRKTLNEQGSVEGDVDVSTAAITGSYSLEVYTSNDILLATKTFMIEEFVPDRIKVTAKLDKPFLRPGDATSLFINAINFFGPPASNRNYEAEIQIKQKSFNPKKYPRYDFDLANQNTFFDKIVKQGSTDENGNAAELYKVPDTYSNMGILQSTFFATVFDETGRPVSRSVFADIVTQPVFLGVGSDGYGYYPLHQTISFPVIAIDQKETLLNGARAEIKVIKHEYRTVLAKTGSYFHYQSQKEDKLISRTVITVSGDKTFYPFVPRSPGDYELRVSLPGTANYVSRSFYSYGSWGADNASFEVNREGSIDIELDKSTYQAGETVKVLFATPFSGKMLVTMETDELISHQYVEVQKRTVSLDMKVTTAHIPNIYITATLIKPHDVSDIPLTVAHGFSNVIVEEKSRLSSVQITALKSVRSRTHQKVKVKALPNSYITLAAVDNGVLQVTGFRTPDPYNHFYAKKALEVNGYNIYPLLFPELKARLSSTGGDGEAEMSKRINPMPNKRIKIVSYWSRIVKANGNGEANFEVDIPAFSGQVRLMAVAYKDESFGSAEFAMTVADPIVLSTALPRFLSPSDTVNVPVTITNTTGKNTSAVAVISVSGPLQVIGGKSQTLNLPANSESRAAFRVVAAPTISAGKVNIEVQGLGEKFVEETDISVRPSAGLQKLSGSGSVNGKATQRITIGSSDFMPGSSAYNLVISRSPALELANQLQYLVKYPYGCTEQVVSAAFPQLYYSDLAELMQPDKSSRSNANYNIQQAIRQIMMRQLYNGAILLWDNEGTENWWVTIYAAHFLLEAQKAGYDVDKALIETILGYINNKLKKRETINYYYNRDQQKKIAPKEVSYGLYVLAVAGRPNIPVMNYYKANPQLLSIDGRYLLSASYAVAGDRNKFRELLPSSFSGEESIPQTGGSFYSDIRDEAIALNVLIDVEPGNAQIPVMARHVVNKLKQRVWYSTQESAFSFLAIGKLARSSGKSTVTGEVKVNGRLAAKVNGNPVRLTAKDLGGTSVDLVTTGEGRLYYWWQSEGISMTGTYQEEDNYIKVRRQFFDRFGRKITGTTFTQNDINIVQIVVEKSFSGNVDNVVITDMLPAGFEIENPRTKEIPGMDWIKDASSPTQLDARDDRINLFVDLVNNKQVYYYAVRAVSPGIYRMGPVSADAMYNGEYHSYHGAGIVRVVQR
ncbi:MAG: MG2 domain-containing protein [Chitinophagaceae bacterium]